MIEQVLHIESYRVSYFALPLFFTSLLTLSMGVYVFAKIHPTKLGRSFFFFTTVLSSWLTMFGIGYSTDERYVALWWFRLGIAAVTIIPASNYTFVDALLQKQRQPLGYVKLIWAVSLAFVVLNLWSDLVIRDISRFSWGFYPQYGKFGIFLVIFFVAVVSTIFSRLWIVYQRAGDERNRNRMRGLLFGISIGYIASVDNLAGFGFAVYPFGYFPILLFVGILTYVIMEYRLADITPQTAASQILKTMQGALIVVDAEDRIRVVNNAACIMFGLEEEEMLNNRLSEVLRLPSQLCDHTLLAQRSVRDFELSIFDKEGKKVFLSVSASVLATANDVPSAIVYVAVDITKHKELEAALAKAKGEAETLVRERTAELWETVSSLRNEIEERARMELALKKAAEEWRSTFDSTKDVIIMLNSEFEVLKANRAAGDVLGLSLPDVIGAPLADSKGMGGVFKGTDIFPALRQAKHRIEREIYLDDKQLWLDLTADPIFSSSGQFSGAVLIGRDVSDVKRAEEEHKNLQAQLMQIQKMESIGRLTGGIAHDFNNVLSAILGYAELTMYKLDENHPARDSVKIIIDSGERAAALIHQLLAFSRKQVLEMTVVNVEETIEHMMKMLARVIGEDIRLVVQNHSPLKSVMADNGQLQQVVMNLVVNARDAMPSGGTLTIETQAVTLDEKYTRYHEGLKPGSYVMLAVKDTGHGMTPEVRKKIFEPFFTTKPVGKGTGLGLATVYGIVKQHSGYIMVDSVLGRGSTFKIFLPVVDEKERMVLIQKETGFSHGSETILVVDDEPSLRNLVRKALSPVGYRVLEASSAEDALAICGTLSDKIDLLLTDVIMPGMDGKRLAKMVHESRPETKVIFISGYTDDILAEHGILEPGVVYVKKPITPTKLSKKVREVLDEPVLR